MAWKRGTQNNQAGAIRKGQIKEFLRVVPKESRDSGLLRIIELEKVPSLTGLAESTVALISTHETGLPPMLERNIHDNSVYLYAHGMSEIV